MDVAVLKAFVHMDDRGFLEGLTAETFWEFLRPLLKGKVHSGKDRVRQLITDMTGNPDGGLTPFLKEPAKLQNQHDLPRYLLYMKAKYGDMEEVSPTSVGVGAFAAEGLLVSCILRMCFVRVLFTAALYVHLLHAYGLTPVCVRMCFVRSLF